MCPGQLASSVKVFASLGKLSIPKPSLSTVSGNSKSPATTFTVASGRGFSWESSTVTSKEPNPVSWAMHGNENIAVNKCATNKTWIWLNRIFNELLAKGM
jgi:hypothetical protein